MQNRKHPLGSCYDFTASRQSSWIEFSEGTTIVADLHRMRGIELQLADISYELFESLLNFFRNDLPLERLWVCCIDLSPNPRFSRLGNTIPGHYVYEAVNYIKPL